jgi:hypothetical protein
MNTYASSITSKLSVAEKSSDCRFSGGQAPQQEAQVGDEAHVEHAVGLVDDEDLDAPQVVDVLLQVVDQRPGVPIEHVDALPSAARCFDSRCRRRPRGS